MNQHVEARTKEAALPKTGQIFYCFRALSLPFGLFRVAEATVEWTRRFIYICIECPDVDFGFNVGDNVDD